MYHRSISGLEKLKNANQSVNTVNDQLFTVELTEIADCPNICFIRFRTNLTRVIGGNFGVYTFTLPLSLFPK